MHQVFLPPSDGASVRHLALFPPVKMAVQLLVTVVARPSQARNVSVLGNPKKLVSMKMVF
jgi:hypothetical protein